MLAYLGLYKEYRDLKRTNVKYVVNVNYDNWSFLYAEGNKHMFHNMWEDHDFPGT